jgi:hypothetical protein
MKLWLASMLAFLPSSNATAERYQRAPKDTRNPKHKYRKSNKETWDFVRKSMSGRGHFKCRQTGERMTANISKKRLSSMALEYFGL